MTMPRWIFSFAVRFPLFVLILLFSVIWGLAGFINISLKPDLERLLSDQQFSAVSAIAASIDQETHLRLQALDELARSIGKRTLISEPKQLDEFLHDNLAVGALFNGGLLMLDATGVCLADASDMPDRVGLNLADRDYFIAALEQRKPWVGIPVAGKLSDRPLVAMSVPITDTFGKVTGVLAGITYLDAENFIRRIVATYRSKGGGVLIIDPKSGRFVAATHSSRTFQLIPAPGVNQMHDRYMAGFEGSGVALNSRGIEELSSSHRIPTAQWFAVAVLPVAIAFAPITAVQNTILSAALFLSLVIPLLATLVIHHWLAPLRDTTRALRNMATGQRLLEPLPVTTRNEIGQLITSFNQFQARIRDNENLLREQRSRLDATLEAARMCFIEWVISTEEPVARALLDRVHPEDRDRIATVIARDLATHGQFLVEFRRDQPAVNTPWFMARGRIFDSSATNRQAIAIVWDITEFKMAELALYENEERFEAIVDSLNDAVFLHEGQSGRILFVNAKASEMFGYTREALVSLTIGDMSAEVPPYTQQDAMAWLTRAWEGEPQFFEWRAKDAQGRLFWIEANARVARISGGQQLVVVVRDIDHRKQAAMALQESEERYRSLLALSPDAIFVHHQGIMVMANSSALQLFGAEREDQLLGLPWTARVHPDFHQIARERVEQIQDTAADCLAVLPVIEPRCMLRLDGSAIDVEVTTSKIMLAEGSAVLSIARDVTQRKRDEAQLKTLLTQQEAILDNAIVGIVLLKQRVIIQCNRRFEEMFGYGEGEMLGYTTRIIYRTDEDYQAIGERAYSALDRGEVYLEEIQLKRKDGSIFWGYLHGRALDLNYPENGSVWIYTDQTDQKQAQEHLQLAASVFENAAEGIMITGADDIILAINQAFTEITGYTAEDVVGNKPDLLKSGRQDAVFYQQMWQALVRNGEWRGEIWNRRKNGEIYPEILSIQAIKDKAGRITNYIAMFTDIAEKKRSENQLAFLIHHDPLTELPNRVLFTDRLDHGIQRTVRGQARLAVLFIDLDHFKTVNDSLGHPLGDQALQMIAHQLTQAVRTSDTLARLGGDKFILMIEDINGVQDTVLIAQKLLNTFTQPFILAGYELYLSASIGISIYPTDGNDAHELIKNAEAAMYQAKAKGRNNYHYYAREMTADAAERLQLESMLRRSIERNELVVYFQPQVDLASGALIGAEALVRWQHPTLGLIPPIKFIPLAEETGFISALGEWVLRNACLKLKTWRAAGYQLPKVSVNLSIKQFERGDVVHLVEKILTATGLPPECLELEITESFVVNADDAFGFIAELKALGISLSVDDFGTGYSSLMYLKNLPIQQLKIDRSFVIDIGQDTNNEAIVRTIIALAKNLGLAVIAEGVETKAQADFLLSEGCPQGQGYYYDKPLPEKEFVERWLARQGVSATTRKD
ncbi:MAG: PAS domain S-box protein [Candidatus Competibacteraceae bacterium]|nr:PAS domain S-box protein [Candidatus Competibacteraceae bacterium]